METHGNTVSWTDEGVTAWASTQGISSVRDGLAGALQLDQSKVRVITEYMGGGFGAKFGAGAEGVLAARLSREAKAPVRLMLTRFDQALAVGNRPSSFQKIKMGALADGTLHAFEMENYGTAGIGAGGDAGGGGGGADIPAPYLYKVPNTRVKQSAVAVNAGSARAFRAPGNPPASFGMESAMDDLAVKLGMDPLEFRLKNDPNEVRQREYDIGAEKFGWKEKYQKPGSSPGVGENRHRLRGRRVARRRPQPLTPRAKRKSIPTAASSSASACRTSAPARKPSSPSSRRKCSASSRSRSP